MSAFLNSYTEGCKKNTSWRRGGLIYILVQTMPRRETKDSKSKRALKVNTLSFALKTQLECYQYFLVSTSVVLVLDFEFSSSLVSVWTSKLFLVLV